MPSLACTSGRTEPLSPARREVKYTSEKVGLGSKNKCSLHGMLALYKCIYTSYSSYIRPENTNHYYAGFNIIL